MGKIDKKRSAKKGLSTQWFRIKFFQSLPKKYKLQVGKILNKTFGTGSGKTKKELTEKKDRYFNDLFAYLLAIEGDFVIGIVGLCKRKIRYKGKTITLGGFSGVCTVIEKRRMGIATALLKRGIEELKFQDCDIAYLCADIYNPRMLKLYGRAGFLPLGKPHTYLGKSGKRYTDKDGMIAPIKSKDKFDFILKTKDIFDIGAGNW